MPNSIFRVLSVLLQVSSLASCWCIFFEMQQFSEKNSFEQHFCANYTPMKIWIDSGFMDPYIHRLYTLWYTLYVNSMNFTEPYIYFTQDTLMWYIGLHFRFISKNFDDCEFSLHLSTAGSIIHIIARYHTGCLFEHAQSLWTTQCHSSSFPCKQPVYGSKAAGHYPLSLNWTVEIWKRY